jgi:hypothetical protein
MDSLQRIAVALAVVAATSWAMVAYSVADTAGQPSQTVPEAAEPGGNGSSAAPLSERLDRSSGVIRPPAGIDPDLSQTPPQSGRTPVIPPPGTSSGDSGINPK